MSRSLGPHLPDALVARLADPDPSAGYGRAIVLLTVDPYGWSHPALVSWAELAVLDSRRLRVALHAGTRTSTQLRDGGRGTLVVVEGEQVLYVKVEAVPLPTAPGADDLARFELHVRDVLEDRAEGEEAGARVIGGVTFEWPGGPEAWGRHRARMRAVLSA